MDEQLNSVNAEQEQVVDAPIAEQVAPEVESVNAEQVEVTPTESDGKPVQDAETNAIYAKIRREAEAKAREKAQDELIAEQYGEQYGIYTLKDYRAAIAKQKEQEQIQALTEEKSIPEEIAKELLEYRQTKGQMEAMRREQERKDAEFLKFGQAYPGVKADEIPAEVWSEFVAGNSLADAYSRHENKSLKQKIAELEKLVGIQQKNATNSATGTGSLTGDGPAMTNGFFTQEQVKAMTPEQVKKNIDAIDASMKKW